MRSMFAALEIQQLAWRRLLFLEPIPAARSTVPAVRQIYSENRKSNNITVRKYELENLPVV